MDSAYTGIVRSLSRSCAHVAAVRYQVAMTASSFMFSNASSMEKFLMFNLVRKCVALLLPSPPFLQYALLGAFVLLSMEILSYFERIQHTFCSMFSNKKNSNENMYFCLFNSAIRMAVASTVWEIQTVKNKEFLYCYLYSYTQMFYQ